MENHNGTAENANESGGVIPETSGNKTKTWIYHIVCILLFAAGVVFLIIFYDVPILFHWQIIMFFGFAAVIAVIWCFFTMRTNIVKYVVLIIAAIMLAAGWYIYFRYIPKYNLADACAIVKADPKYASATVEPQYYEAPKFSISWDGGTVAGPNVKVNSSFLIEDNPFYTFGYVLDVFSDGKWIETIGFDPATGKYEALHELKD